MTPTSPLTAADRRQITLEARSLEYAYPERHAGRNHRASQGGAFQLGPISLELAAREFLAIIGPNGSGKSTLLNLLGGLVTPASGRVYFGGSELCSLIPRERAKRVAYVRQDTPLAFPIRVSQFVALGRFAFFGKLGFEGAKDHKMVAWALEATSLDRLANRRMDEISGGERQRAILARALAQEPELLLLDEPTASLDLSFQLELLRLVRGMVEDHDITAVAVMHELNLASEFADFLLLLKNGRVVCLGNPNDVLTRERLSDAYGVPVAVDRNPYSGRPRVSLLAGREE
jgi:iron complex transport system ATP-binding protein